MESRQIWSLHNLRAKFEAADVNQTGGMPVQLPSTAPSPIIVNPISSLRHTSLPASPGRWGHTSLPISPSDTHLSPSGLPAWIYQTRHVLLLLRVLCGSLDNYHWASQSGLGCWLNRVLVGYTAPE